MKKREHITENKEKKQFTGNKPGKREIWLKKTFAELKKKKIVSIRR